MSMMKNTLIAAAMAGVAAIPLQAETVRLGSMAWEDILPITGVVQHVLESQGHDVEVTEFSEWGIAYAALTRGDVELLISEVDYVAHDYWERNNADLEKISIVSHGLFQALAVPSYVDISSTDELNAHADEFGGEIIGIEPGSGLMRETADAVEAYGLDLRLVEGSTAAMTAALKAAVDRNEPIVVTLWDPTWMFLEYDMKFLADPLGIFSPPQAYNMIGVRGYSQEHPEVREILASIFVPIDQVRAMNAAVNNGQTMDEAIESWIEANGDLITRWMNNASN